MPPEVHLDPLPIIDGNESCHQAFVMQDASSSLMQVGLENSQEGGLEEDDCLVIKQDTLETFTPSGPSTLGISTLEIKDDQWNTLSADTLVITINYTTSRPDRDHRARLEDTLDNVIVNSLGSVTTKTYGVITLEVELANLWNEPEVTSCHVAIGIGEEITTSSMSTDVEDIVEGMRNLFS
ncbi:hypothetical protein AAC387_Pa10g0247 [Persea americana]